MQLEDFAMACGPKPVCSRSAHEHPTSLGTALTGTVQHRRHQCALQLTDGSGSARDRHRWTTGASLSRRRRGGRGLCDGLPGELGLRPANRRGAGVRGLSAHHSALPRTLCCRGMAALGREEGWRRGRRRISGKRLCTIERLKSHGLSNRAIAHRLGVNEKAIRKLVGPSKPTESAQLGLPVIKTDAEKPAESGAPSAAPSGKEKDRARAVEEKTTDGDAVAAPDAANDDEPVPMSLDRDAEDRTFDRQLAYLSREMLAKKARVHHQTIVGFRPTNCSSFCKTFKSVAKASSFASISQRRAHTVISICA